MSVLNIDTGGFCDESYFYNPMLRAPSPRNADPCLETPPAWKRRIMALTTGPNFKSETPPAPNYPFLRDSKYHLIETIRPLIEVHWGV